MVILEERFRQKFRMGIETFNKLSQSLRPYLQKKDTIYRKAIPLDKRIAVVLYFFKGGSDYSTIADLFGIGESTVGCLVQQFCDAMLKKHKGLVRFPETEEEKEKIANGYFEKWQYYNCFGSMDGTHIPILAPQINTEDYYCYKSFHSINVLAVVDDNYLFR